MSKIKITIVFGIILLFSNVTYVFTAEFEFSMNDIEWCNEVYPQYEVLGLEWFIKNYHYSIEARVCGSLYEDPLWNYQGEDRMQKLLERSMYYIELEIQESLDEAKSGVNDPTPAIIPSWIKSTGSYWVDGFTSDLEFVNAMQFLIDEGILVVSASSSSQSAASEVPPWIKTTTGYWVDNKITDDEFITAIQWLINNGIIRV
ncbi:MAG: hypothetical protein ACE5R3_03840 [Nitrosopumilaceae archaeon]